MIIEITVPPLPESVTEATLMSWHKKVGDYVNRDDISYASRDIWPFNLKTRKTDATEVGRVTLLLTQTANKVLFVLFSG